MGNIIDVQEAMKVDLRKRESDGISRVFERQSEFITYYPKFSQKNKNYFFDKIEYLPQGLKVIPGSQETLSSKLATLNNSVVYTETNVISKAA